ncbi:MAG: energy transducer TonB [Alphaproteobacteria bacterium]|nr:energy transducer TonB [Alphaproteobacteria bacterium]
MVYGLLTSLGVIDVPKPVSDLIVVNVADIPKLEELPPPIMPVIETPRVENVIVPVVTLDYIPPQPRAITLPAPPSPPPQLVQAPPAPPPEPAFVPPLSIAETHTIPDYPPVSRRLGERGTTHLMLTINEQGIVAGATIVDSSDYRRLDEAAMNWIKANWRYTPAREGAKAVSSKIEAEVEFRLL